MNFSLPAGTLECGDVDVTWLNCMDHEGLSFMLSPALPLCTGVSISGATGILQAKAASYQVCLIAETL